MADDNYSDEVFLSKLESLSSSQNVIQGISQWVLNFKKHAKSIAKIWYKELKKGQLKHKLALMYLLNEIVQSSRKKIPEFIKVFCPVVSHAVKDLCKSGDSKTKDCMHHLVDIWRERKVFDETILVKCDVVLGLSNASSGSHSRRSKRSSVTTMSTEESSDITMSMQLESQRASASVTKLSNGISTTTVAAVKNLDMSMEKSSPQVQPLSLSQSHAQTVNSGFNVVLPHPLRSIVILREELAAHLALEKSDKAPDIEQVLTGLTYLANAPSADADTRQRIATFPLHISEEASVDSVVNKSECMALEDQVNEADLVLLAYNAELEKEMRRRQEMQTQLVSFYHAQLGRLEESRHRLLEMRAKLECVHQIQVELNRHLNNLPDLSLLPDVTGGGLAPLPSVGDLFG